MPRWAWLGGGALLAALGAALLLLLARRSRLSRKLREEAAKALEKRLASYVREGAGMRRVSYDRGSTCAGLCRVGCETKTGGVYATS